MCVAGFLLLQLAWLVTIPPFGGIDEFDHVYRAAAVAAGDLVADQVPEDGRGLLVEVPPDIVEAAHAQCAELPYTRPDNCASAGEAPGGRVLVASGAATYHPAFYWVVGTVGRPWTGVDSLYAMRAATALLCSLFLGMAAWAATRTPGPWPLAGLAVALTPVLVYSTTVVAPNGLEMTAALALWASLLRLRVERDPGVARRLLLVAVLSATVVATLRLLGPLWVLLAVATVAAFDPGGTRRALVRHARPLCLGVLLVVLSTANLVAWLLGPARAASNPDPVDGDVSIGPVNLAVWALQAIAAFPFRNQPGPPVVYVVVGIAFVLLVVMGLRSLRGAARLVLLVSLGAALVLPLLATLATLDGRGLVWQGRYGLPFAVGVALIASQAVAERSRPVPLSRVVLAGASVAFTIAVSASVLKVRAAEIADGSVAMAGGTWSPPMPAVVVLVVLLGMAALAAAVHSAASGAPAAPGEPGVDRATDEAAGARS